MRGRRSRDAIGVPTGICVLETAALGTGREDAEEDTVDEEDGVGILVLGVDTTGIKEDPAFDGVPDVCLSLVSRARRF